MRSYQGETSHAVIKRRTLIECHVLPTVKRLVAAFASRRKLRGHMVGIRRLLEVRQMAGRTCRRKPLEDSRGGLFVALIALQNRVRPKQREAIEVLLNRLNRDLPAVWCVALRAIRAELSAMDIRMTVRAILSDIRENWFQVASRAGNFFVHSAEWVAS